MKKVKSQLCQQILPQQKKKSSKSQKQTPRHKSKSATKENKQESIKPVKMVMKPATSVKDKQLKFEQDFLQTVQQQKKKEALKQIDEEFYSRTQDQAQNRVQSQLRKMVAQKTHEILIEEITNLTAKKEKGLITPHKQPLVEPGSSPMKSQRQQIPLEDKIQRFEDLNRLAFYKTYLENKNQQTKPQQESNKRLSLQTDQNTILKNIDEEEESIRSPPIEIFQSQQQSPYIKHTKDYSEDHFVDAPKLREMGNIIQPHHQSKRSVQHWSQKKSQYLTNTGSENQSELEKSLNSRHRPTMKKSGLAISTQSISGRESYGRSIISNKSLTKSSANESNKKGRQSIQAPSSLTLAKEVAKQSNIISPTAGQRVNRKLVTSYQSKVVQSYQMSPQNKNVPSTLSNMVKDISQQDKQFCFMTSHSSNNDKKYFNEISKLRYSEKGEQLNESEASQNMQDLVQELHTLTSTTSEQSKHSCQRLEDNSSLKLDDDKIQDKFMHKFQEAMNRAQEVCQRAVEIRTEELHHNCSQNKFGQIEKYEEDRSLMNQKHFERQVITERQLQNKVQQSQHQPSITKVNQFNNKNQDIVKNIKKQASPKVVRHNASITNQPRKSSHNQLQLIHLSNKTLKRLIEQSENEKEEFLELSQNYDECLKQLNVKHLQTFRMKRQPTSIETFQGQAILMLLSAFDHQIILTNDKSNIVQKQWKHFQEYSSNVGTTYNNLYKVYKQIEQATYHPNFIRSMRSIILPMSTFNLTGDFLLNKYLNAALDLATFVYNILGLNQAQPQQLQSPTSQKGRSNSETKQISQARFFSPKSQNRQQANQSKQSNQNKIRSPVPFKFEGEQASGRYSPKISEISKLEQSQKFQNSIFNESIKREQREGTIKEYKQHLSAIARERLKVKEMERLVREMSMERDLLLRQIEREDREKKKDPRSMSGSIEREFTLPKSNTFNSTQSTQIQSQPNLPKLSDKTLERLANFAKTMRKSNEKSSKYLRYDTEDCERDSLRKGNRKY